MNTDSYNYYHVPEIRKDGSLVWVTLGQGKQKRDFAGVIQDHFYDKRYASRYQVKVTYVDLAGQERTTTINARPDQLKDRYEETQEDIEKLEHEQEEQTK